MNPGIPVPKQIAILAVFAAIAVLPMLFRGIPGGNDAAQHYEFAQHVVDAFRSGDLFPHFAGNANHGFGDVGLRVYPPLSYYALAFGYLIFGEWYDASIAVFFLVFFVGAVGVFVWSRELFDINSSLAAAAIYTFAPFHLNEIYNNFLFAEFAAGAVLPFCFLFVTRVLKNGGLLNLILLGVSYALLIATHLPLTIIGSLAMVICAIASLRRNNLARIGNLAASAALGGLLSSFYWVRTITEMDWVKHSQPEYFANIWSYQENFLISARTFTDFMGDGLSLWFGDLILIATLLICIPAIVLFARTSDDRKNYAALFVLLGFATVMTTPVTSFLWNIFPLLQKVQFPWRWLTIVSLSASMIAGPGLVLIARKLRSDNSKPIAIGVAAAVLPFVFLSAFVVRAPHFTQREEFNAKGAELSAGETFEGWWPIWAKREAFSRTEMVAASDRNIEIKEWSPTRRSFSVAAGDASTVEVSTFIYPHWKATIAGTALDTDVTQDGIISLQVPTDSADIELNFIEPPIVELSVWISLASWTLAAIVLLLYFVRRVKSYGTYS